MASAEDMKSIRSSISGAVAAMTLISYDILLTLPHEIRCIWRRSLTGPTVVFLVIRYSTLLGSALAVAQSTLCPNMYLSCDVCNNIRLVVMITTTIVLLALAAFCSLRVYAISGKAYKIAAVVFALLVIGDSLNLYELLSTNYKLTPLHACILTSERPESSTIAGYVAVVISIVAELIVQVATWRKTAQLRSFMRELGMGQPPVIVLLLRDGTLGFLFVSLWIVIFQFVPADSSLSPCTVPILSIFICRFMLRLRSVYIPADTQAASASFDSGPMVFSAVAGNMGAPLDVRLFGNDSGYDTGHEDEDEAILITVDPLGSPAGIEEEGL